MEKYTSFFISPLNIRFNEKDTVLKTSGGTTLILVNLFNKLPVCVNKAV